MKLWNIISENAQMDMYRKLTMLLHPDRQKDDLEIMKKINNLKDKNDWNGIEKIYKQHVGEPPQDLPDNQEDQDTDQNILVFTFRGKVYKVDEKRRINANGIGHFSNEWLFIGGTKGNIDQGRVDVDCKEAFANPSLLNGCYGIDKDHGSYRMWGGMYNGKVPTIQGAHVVKKKEPLGLKEARTIGGSLKRQQAHNIYQIGLVKSAFESFDADKWMNDIAKHDDTGEFIYMAGLNWKKFNFKKGLDLLLKGRLPKWIVYAGINWKEFDFGKARDELRRRLNWIKSQNNYDAQDVQNIEYWMVSAKAGWPKNAQETIEAGDEMKAKATKMPKKPFGLKEAMNFASSIEGQGRVRIVMNPSVEEIEGVAMYIGHPTEGSRKMVHFVFDAVKKSLYVFSPNEYHSRVMVELGLDTSQQQTGRYPHGAFIKTDNGWRIKSMKGITQETYKKTENYIRGHYLRESSHKQ
jgi:hypothetical protein